MSRKIIQISVTQDYRGNPAYVFALCDDGTVWSKTDGVPWLRTADIPLEVTPNLDDLGCEADF